MRRLWIAIAMCLAVAAAATSGCDRAASSEEARVRSTIERYNALLAEGYRNMDMNPMRQVATELQSEDEYIHMSSLAEGGVRLLPELKKFEFLKVSVEATSASAETLEVWDYEHESRESKKIVLVQRDLEYHLAWDLEKQANGTWLVSDVRAISATSAVEPEVIDTLTPLPVPHSD